MSGFEDNVIPTVGVVCFREVSHGSDGSGVKEVLLIRHTEHSSHPTNSYGVPAGKVREGDSAIETAVRKFHEESGLYVLNSDLVVVPKKWQATFERKDGAKTFSLEVFVAQKYSGELILNEKEVPEWILLSCLDSIHLLPNQKEAVLVALDVLDNI